MQGYNGEGGRGYISDPNFPSHAEPDDGLPRIPPLNTYHNQDIGCAGVVSTNGLSPQPSSGGHRPLWSVPL